MNAATQHCAAGPRRRTATVHTATRNACYQPPVRFSRCSSQRRVYGLRTTTICDRGVRCSLCIAAERPELESPATTYTVNARRQQRAQGPAPSNPFGANDLVSRPVINTASPRFLPVIFRCRKDTGHRRVPLAENRITRLTRQVVRCYAVRHAALPIFGRIPCLETPRTRIQNCANAILPKSCTAGPGRPVFRACLFDCLLLTAPPAFFGLALRSWLAK